MRKLIAGALALSLFLTILVPVRIEANPLALGALKVVAGFLASYGAEKILDEVLFDGPERTLLDNRLNSMRAEYLSFKSSSNVLESIVRANTSAVNELRYHIELLQVRAQTHDSLHQDAATALQQINARLSARDQAPDNFLTTLPARIDMAVATRNRPAARALSEEILRFLPLFEHSEPLSRFLEEVLAFARNTVDRLQQLETAVHRLETAVDVHGNRIDEVEKRVGEHNNAIAELSERMEEQEQKQLIFQRLMQRIVESNARRMQHQWAGQIVEVVAIQEDYSSPADIMFLLVLAGTVQHACGVQLISSPALPGEPVHVRSTLSYETECFKNPIGRNGFFSCKWKIDVSGNQSLRLTRQGVSSGAKLDVVNENFQRDIRELVNGERICDILR